jgi:hypothetical protein
MTAEELMDQYKMVREEEFGLGLGLIINPDAQVGGILLVGMNPSGKGDDIYSFNECEGAFWNPKHDMLGGRGRGYDTKCGYIDLLPVRNGNQSKVHLDNDIKNRYHGRLLAHTRDYIEELRPRLIIFANKTANYYWGFNKKKPWMGYTFQEIESPLDGERKYWKLFQITGIEPTDVNRNVNETNLKGTYFLQYRQHNNRNRKTVSEERVLRFEDIRSIAKFIDEKWEKTLY